MLAPTAAGFGVIVGLRLLSSSTAAAVVLALGRTAAAAAALGVRVIVPMVVMMIMSAATAAAAPLGVRMRIGIDKRRSQTPLHRHRLLNRRVGRFHAKRHHFRRQPDIVDAAEIMPPQTSLPVEDQRRRRALDLIRRHGLRDIPAVLRVLGDRKRQPLLGQKLSQLVLGLLFGLLKGDVEPDHGHLVVREPLRHPLRLWQPMLERARTMRLKRGQHDDPPFQARKRLRLRRIQPVGSGKLGRVLGIEHG